MSALQGMYVEFADGDDGDFVIARRVVPQVPAVGDIVWLRKNRYRVTEVTWFLDDDAGEEGPRTRPHVADVRLAQAGRPGNPEVEDNAARTGDRTTRERTEGDHQHGEPGV